jgi:hypothetical protein
MTITTMSRRLFTARQKAEGVSLYLSEVLSCSEGFWQRRKPAEVIDESSMAETI